MADKDGLRLCGNHVDGIEVLIDLEKVTFLRPSLTRTIPRRRIASAVCLPGYHSLYRQGQSLGG